MDSTANNYNADATEDDGSCTFDEEEDEVPGFGLLSAIAALGVALILRRRL
jgi:PGF-CTERM protein